MTFPRGKQIKLSKYCYRMNNACGQRNFRKAGDYFNHLKFHAMTGGAGGDISQENKDLLTAIGAKLASVVGELGRLQTELDRVNQDLAVAKSGVATATSAQAAAVAVGDSQQVQELNKEIAQLKQEIAQLQSEKASIESQITTLTVENTQLKAERDDIQGRYNALDAKTNAMNDEYKKGLGIGRQFLDAPSSADLNAIQVNSTEYENATEALDYLKQIRQAVEEKLDAIKQSGVKTAEAQAAKAELDRMKTNTEEQIKDLNQQLLASQSKVTEVEGELVDAKDNFVKERADAKKAFDESVDSTNTADNTSFNTALMSINDKLQEVIDNYTKAAAVAPTPTSAASSAPTSAASSTAAPTTQTQTQPQTPTAAESKVETVASSTASGEKAVAPGMGQTPQQVIKIGSTVRVVNNKSIGKNSGYPRNFNIKTSADTVEGIVISNPDSSGNVTVKTEGNKSFITPLTNLELVSK